MQQVTQEQARAQFGDAPFVAMAKESYAHVALFVDGDSLMGDLTGADLPEEGYPAVWCPELNEWDLM